MTLTVQFNHHSRPDIDYNPIPTTNLPDISMPPPSIIPLPRKRKQPEFRTPTHDSARSSPSGPSESDVDPKDDEEYDPGPSRPAPKARKRQQPDNTGPTHDSRVTKIARGAGSKSMSREALRKANHSLIERRRREKINFALGELREMVPGLGDTGGGGEFKLEVLERTVLHMRELKRQVAELENQLGDNARETPGHMAVTSNGLGVHTGIPTGSRTSSDDSSATTQSTKKSRPSPSAPSAISSAVVDHHSSSTPPTPGQSPGPSIRERDVIDPNETDLESNLPPPFALAERRHNHGYTTSNHISSQPSITQLLANTETSSQSFSYPSTRPAAPPEAHNPTLYLPFPTPSPTSPFLTCSGTSSSSIMEPSPFLAPIQNIGLFGGALNLDNSPVDALRKFAHPVPIATEEEAAAANLLLAFSSPDTLRPTQTGSTPKVVPVSNAVPVGRERRSTLESEEFVLDGGQGTAEAIVVQGKMPVIVAGKTARDILKM